jgi:hypothetical protein
MADARLPDDFYDLVSHHLPPEQPVGPKGGRPRIGHRIALKVIWFVLVTGCRWGCSRSGIKDIGEKRAVLSGRGPELAVRALPKGDPFLA